MLVQGMDNNPVKELAGAIAIGMAAIVVVLTLYQLGRSCEIRMIRTWAKENSFELLSFRPRGFFEPAPFFFLLSHRQPQYLVAVRDPEGKERSGWVQLGTFFEGISGGGKHVVEVRWKRSLPLA
jgi:hypothetical protein